MDFRRNYLKTDSLYAEEMKDTEREKIIFISGSLKKMKSQKKRNKFINKSGYFLSYVNVCNIR